MKMMRTITIGFAAVLAATSAFAAPTSVTVTPPQGARFLVGQQFDIRVEGQGAANFSATLRIDGKPVAFSSGTQSSAATDGITKSGWGGFWYIRGVGPAEAAGMAAVSAKSRPDFGLPATISPAKRGREGTPPRTT